MRVPGTTGTLKRKSVRVAIHCPEKGCRRQVGLLPTGMRVALPTDDQSDAREWSSRCGCGHRVAVQIVSDQP